MRTYYVPKGQVGNFWTVFRITGDGDIQDINRMQGLAGDHEPLSNVLLGLVEGGSVAPAQAASQPAAVAQAGNAVELNKQGEMAYHAGQLDQAIDLYRQAIEIDGNYGQAYSNLGLAYQKAGRTAEAIWANRKAIALAHGGSAATVRASSYYNIARIYENARQYDDALRHYQLAKEQKANPVYDKAIQRVQAL